MLNNNVEYLPNSVHILTCNIFYGNIVGIGSNMNALLHRLNPLNVFLALLNIENQPEKLVKLGCDAEGCFGVVEMGARGL